MEEKRIGFWSKSDSPDKYIDASWDTNERSLVIDYLKAAKVKDYYFGVANCRLNCKKQIKTVSDMYDDGFAIGCADMTDGEYIFPEGYVHYVEAHGVKPPVDFINHIIEKRQTSSDFCQCHHQK